MLSSYLSLQADRPDFLGTPHCFQLNAEFTPLPMTQQPLVGQGLFIIEASRSDSNTPHPVGLLWTSDKPDAETSTWQHTRLTRDRYPVSPAGFEPAIPASEWPQTHALVCVATGIGQCWISTLKLLQFLLSLTFPSLWALYNVCKSSSAVK
jgi:hypothetical protein